MTLAHKIQLDPTVKQERQLRKAAGCTLSTGEVIDAPKPLKASRAGLRRRSRQHSRKQKGSRNRTKSAQRLAKLHMKISNVRKDFLHKTTSKLVARAKLLVIEDLSLAGMSNVDEAGTKPVHTCVHKLGSMKYLPILLAMILLPGCSLSPSRSSSRIDEYYKADTTPEHDGEDWIGGR